MAYDTAGVDHGEEDAELIEGEGVERGGVAHRVRDPKLR
jgi:hypothetical protein